MTPLNNAEVRMSKRLAWCLRHGATKIKLPMSSDGYVLLEAIFSLKEFRQLTLDVLEKIVHLDSKKRFFIDKSDSDSRKWRIRANQGHSIPSVLSSELLKPVSISETKDMLCVHGTYLRHWDSIYNQGLCRMARNHIHFAAGEIGENDVISGMRTSAELKIYVDVRKVIEDGMPFYRSANNVLLCSGEGEKGVLSRKYFIKVVRVKDHSLIYSNVNDAKK